jgi:hypothetical protein
MSLPLSLVSLARCALAVTASALLVAGCEGAGAGGQGDTRSGTSDSAGPDDTAPSSGRGGARDGDQNSGDQNSGGKGRTGGSASTLPRCHTDQLHPRLTALDPGAGNRYAALVLTNDADRSCRTYGWVGLQLAAPGNRPLATRVVREGKARSIVLKPGQSGWARLRWSAVPGEGEPDNGPCRRSATALLIIPPDETTQLTATWRYGPACDGGRIEATPLAPGTGPAG